MLLLIYIIYCIRKQTPASKEVLKSSRELFTLYLDQFYIKNKVITFSLFFLYIFGYSLIFIMLRYAYLGQINSIGFLKSNGTIWLIISNYIQVIITIILYKLLLDVLFNKEINKLYLYFMSFSWYNTFYTILNFKIAEYLLGCIRLPCYRIATLTYEEDPSNARWVYSRKNNIMYWVLIALQAYIFWILLFKPELIFSNSEIIFDYIIRITKTYTLEDKIMYVFQYFEYHIAHTTLTLEEQELLRYKLRTIEFREIINEKTTLKEIMYNVKIYIQTEYYQNHEEVQAIEREIVRKEALMNEPFKNPWYHFIRNMIIMGIISIASIKTMMHYSDLLEVIKQLLLDPHGIPLIGQKTLVNIYSHGPVKLYIYFTSYLPDFVDLILLNKISDVIHVGLVSFIAGFILLSKSSKKLETYIESWNEDSTYVALPEIKVESIMSLTNAYVLFVGLWTIVIVTCIAFIVFLKRNRNHGTKEKLT